jgi:hypothetical protein
MLIGLDRRHIINRQACHNGPCVPGVLDVAQYAKLQRLHSLTLIAAHKFETLKLESYISQKGILEQQHMHMHSDSARIHEQSYNIR